MSTRLYLVAAIINGITQQPRLIDASTAAAARNFATRNMISIKPASPKEVAALMRSGVAVEIASETPAEQQALPISDTATGGEVVDAEVRHGTSEAETAFNHEVNAEPEAPDTVDPESGAPVVETADASNDETAAPARRRRR